MINPIITGFHISAFGPLPEPKPGQGPHDIEVIVKMKELHGRHTITLRDIHESLKSW
jgi:hypothetical protein